MRLTPITSLRDSKDPHADAIDLAHLRASTIDSSEIGTLAYGGVPLSNIISHAAEGYEKGIRNGFDTPSISAETSDGLGNHIDRSEHLVIRDLDLPQLESSSEVGQGRIIAHAEYVCCPTDWFSRNKFTPADPNTPVDPRLEGGNQALMDEFTAKIYRTSEALIGGQECYMLTALHTLDTHLRKGIATRLVQWIFPYAKSTKRPIFLVASPIGAHVYWKNGYESVGGNNGIIEIQLEDWGGTKGGVHRLLAMRKEPS
ncbi:hypothetical protein BCR39DRAFT_529794 [Naematelia encephala]|uniref:N-acetyltransferase domain-containing protein n=1 Tax=Naematelia encephala TaxID=71784 RepID=A0A1Y2B5Q1_9TREE|nr:hypothetical protein BCR39DRAFT_529794 [Naematelia encephala]